MGEGRFEVVGTPGHDSASRANRRAGPCRWAGAVTDDGGPLSGPPSLSCSVPATRIPLSGRIPGRVAGAPVLEPRLVIDHQLNLGRQT